MAAQTEVETRPARVAAVKNTEFVKVSMNLRREANEAAMQIAKKRSITRTEVVQRGIALEKVIEDIHKRDGTLVVELPDGSRERILIPW